MPSRLFLRRLATAAGLYGSTALGVLGTIVAARSLSTEDFGLFATVFVAVGFFQVLLDLTVEESLTKYGFRYASSEQWGRLRGLFRAALRLKLLGGALAGLALLTLAPLADTIFSSDGLTWAFVAAAPLPLLQSPENVSATALLLRGRYDLRGLLQTVSTGLRLIAIAVGAQLGVVETVVAIGIAQAVATAVVGAVGLAAFRRFPSAPAEPLGEDRPGIVAAGIQLAIGWTKSLPVAIGRPNLRLVTHGIETAVLLPLVVVLALEWGATGAAAATLVATIVFALAWAVVFARVRRRAAT